MTAGVSALVIALQLADPVVVIDSVPITVAQSGQSLIWLAAINVVSLAVLAIIARWADSRKDRATALATERAAVLAAQIKAEEKRLDWARQDEVAQKVADAAIQASLAAKLLVETQADVVRRQDDVAATLNAQNVRITNMLTAIDEQGKKIHILVNSDMTAARTQERDSMKLLVVSLRSQQRLNDKNGIRATEHEQEEITKAEKRIGELNEILADRHAAQLVVEAEARASGTSALPPDIGPGRTPLARDQDSRPADTIISDAAEVLQDIAKNTAETAKNTEKP